MSIDSLEDAKAFYEQLPAKDLDKFCYACYILSQALLMFTHRDLAEAMLSAIDEEKTDAKRYEEATVQAFLLTACFAAKADEENHPTNIQA